MPGEKLGRGERPKHERPQDAPEPQEDARSNTARPRDEQGRDANRSGSDSGGGG